VLLPSATPLDYVVRSRVVILTPFNTGVNVLIPHGARGPTAPRWVWPQGRVFAQATRNVPPGNVSGHPAHSEYWCASENRQSGKRTAKVYGSTGCRMTTLNESRRADAV